MALFESEAVSDWARTLDISLRKKSKIGPSDQDSLCTQNLSVEKESPRLNGQRNALHQPFLLFIIFFQYHMPISGRSWNVFRVKVVCNQLSGISGQERKVMVADYSWSFPACSTIIFCLLFSRNGDCLLQLLFPARLP